MVIVVCIVVIVILGLLFKRLIEFGHGNVYLGLFTGICIFLTIVTIIINQSIWVLLKNAIILTLCHPTCVRPEFVRALDQSERELEIPSNL